MPYAYIIVAAAIGLVASGYIPEGVTSTELSVSVEYGTWFIALLIIIAVLLVRDIYLLARRQTFLADPQERNQVNYLFAGLAVLFTFLVVGFSPAGRGHPIFHIGNFAMAGILTYAVVTHQLLDIKVVLRRGLTYSAIVAFFIGIYLAWLFLFLKVFHLELSFAAILIALLCTAATVPFFVYRAYDVISARVNRLLYGERIESRHRLSEFIPKIHDVPTLEQLDSQLIPLLSQSIDCQRACLLLPRTGSGDFAARFSYPPTEDNPMAKLRLKCDSPVVTWLKQKSQALLKKDMGISPEFQGLCEEEKEGIQSAKVEMFVPIMHSGRLIAILAVGNKRWGKLYSVEDIDLVESTASHVAASMEKEYRNEQLERHDKELTLINRLTTIIISSADIKEIFEGFAQELKEIIGLDYASIALIEGDELHILALSSQMSSVRRVGERIPLKGTSTEWVAEHKEGLYEANLAQHSTFWTAEHYIEEGIRSIIHLRLVVRDKVIGSLIIASRHPDAYSSEQIQLLKRLALQIAAPIENSRLYTQAEQKARIDDLTGLFNRRHFEERLEDEIARHSRYGGIFSMLILDLDSFKTYNDIYGHLAGDKLLREVGGIIKNSIRSADQAFRYGGDEFTFILPETNIDDAYMVAERIRKEIAAEMKARNIILTCSIGLVHYPSNGATFNTLMETADAALYYAKTKGGNQCYIHSKSPAQPPAMVRQETMGISLNAIYALTSVVEARDHYTYGHSRKVNSYAIALAKAIELPNDEITKISASASLHDVGKIGIPDDILNKKGNFTEEDWKIIKAHTKLGASIIGSVPGLVSCIPAVLYHHEHYDGSGYPEGLKGDEIPLEARILAIADAFSAMTSVRPYRGPLSFEQAIEELKRNAGTQFDPKLVEVFINLAKSENFEKETTIQSGTEAQSDRGTKKHQNI